MRSFAELAFTYANTIIALRGFGIVWQQLGVDGLHEGHANRYERHCRFNTKYVVFVNC